MADKRRKVRRYDVDFSSLILFMLTFCLLALVFTAARGSDVMFYAWFPMIGCAVLSLFSMECLSGYVARQTQWRAGHGKMANAMVLLHSALIICVLWAVLAVLLFGVGGNYIARHVLGFSMTGPVMKAFLPAAVLTGIAGCLKGFLYGIGQKRLARMGLWLECALFAALGMVGGFACAFQGERVSALLRNDDMSAIYCGCGIGIGLAAAMLITVVYLALLCRAHVGRLMRDANPGDLYLSDAQRTERTGELMVYCLQKTGPGAASAVMLFLGLLIGYRFWLTKEEELRTALLTSLWGGFVGVGLPVTVACALLCALPFTAMVRLLLRDRTRGNNRAASTRLSLLLRLSAFISIPCSAFLFGAAQEIVAVIPGLTFNAQKAAVITLKSGCFLVFLGQTALLMLWFFWNAGEHRGVLTAAAAGFFAQTAALVVMNFMEISISMLPVSMDFFCVVLLVLMYGIGRQGLIRGIRSTWLTEDIMIAISTGIAVIPLELLNDYLVEVLPAWAALTAAFFLFVLPYMLISILLRAADLRNLHLVPGGRLIVSLAVMLGAADRDTEG